MIFKKKIADNLEDKIIEAIAKHEKNLDFDSKVDAANLKADKANNRMLAGLGVAGFGAVAGVGGLAASLQMGIGAGALVVAGIGTTVGGAILLGGVVGIAAPALAFMGVNKLIKMYHESVANDNDSLFNYRKAEFDVRESFSKKMVKVLGGENSEIYRLASSSGLLSNLSHGSNLDNNTKILIDLAKNVSESNKNDTETKNARLLKNK